MSGHVDSDGLFLGAAFLMFLLLALDWLRGPTRTELQERERERLHRSEGYRRQVEALRRLQRQVERDLD